MPPNPRGQKEAISACVKKEDTESLGKVLHKIDYIYTKVKKLWIRFQNSNQFKERITIKEC